MVLVMESFAMPAPPARKLYLVISVSAHVKTAGEGMGPTVPVSCEHQGSNGRQSQTIFFYIIRCNIRFKNPDGILIEIYTLILKVSFQLFCFWWNPPSNLKPLFFCPIFFIREIFSQSMTLSHLGETRSLSLALTVVDHFNHSLTHSFLKRNLSMPIWLSRCLLLFIIPFWIVLLFFFYPRYWRVQIVRSQVWPECRLL